MTSREFAEKASAKMRWGMNRMTVAEVQAYFEVAFTTAIEQGRRAGLEAAAKVMDDKADHCLQLAEDAPRKEAVWHTRRKEALMYEGAAAAIRAEP